MVIKEAEIRVDLDTSNYEFPIHVIDSSSKSDISGATISGTLFSNQTTNSVGNAKVFVNKEEFDSNSPDGNLHFEVSKEGYVTQSGSALPQDENNKKATEIELVKSDQYYYTVYVKDNSGNPVAGASVQPYKLENGEYTPVGTALATMSNGKHIFIFEDAPEMYFTARKNGYTSSGYVRATAPNRIGGCVITISSTSSANYYYVVRAINESGAGVPNIEVNLYNELAMFSTYDVDASKVKNGRKVTESNVVPTDNEILTVISGYFSFRSGRNVGGDDHINELGMTPLAVTTVMDDIERKYGIVFGENMDFSSVNDRAEYFIGTFQYINNVAAYVKEHANFSGNKKVKYITDANGYISIDLGESGTVPKTIYAYPVKGNYLWSMKHSSVPPTTGLTDVGSTISIITSSGQQDRYYYNVQVVDSYTQNPVKGASVKYAKNGSNLSTKTSSNNGTVKFSSSYSSLSVNIIKDGYDEENVNNFPGIQNDNKYYKSSLTQINPIQVVYGYGDHEGEGVPNILVAIGYYDSKNNFISCGKYKTAESGYIDAVSAGYFASGNSTYYAVVQNYIPADDSKLQYLKKRLVIGGVVISLPAPLDTSGESAEEYVKFYDVSAYAIKNNINNGNKELDANKDTDKVNYAGGGEDYRINVLDPDSITTYDIFQGKPVMMENDNKNVISTIEIGLKYDVNKLRLKVINRYSGYYNPIFKDILFYKNLFIGNNEIPFSNVEFDYEYNDKYGRFGYIDNMWFHKVNEDKNINILNTESPYYPLIGQYALDHRDYNVFESNWDLEHYTKQLDIEHSKPCPNISSQKNGVCMFGSKYLNVPNKIEIYGLTLGDDENWKGEWNDDWITSPDACPGEVMFKEINDNSVDFYFFFTKRIHRFFYDKLKDEFEKYMNVDSNSYGKPGVEDDIREYVTKNVLKLYRLEKVRMFVKRTKKGQHNSRIENDYTKYLEYDKTSGDPNIAEYFEKKGYVQYFKQHGFVEVNNITLSKLNRDDFDRKLVYNLRNGSMEEFGFSFILTKI